MEEAVKKQIEYLQSAGIHAEGKTLNCLKLALRGAFNDGQQAMLEKAKRALNEN